MSLLTDAILQKVTPERLQRAVEGLCSGAYNIALVSHTNEQVCALVSSGDGARYEAVLTPGRAYCGCPDSQFRHSTCKHAVALALHAIRTPQAEAADEQPVSLKLTKTRPGWVFAA